MLAGSEEGRFFFEDDSVLCYYCFVKCIGRDGGLDWIVF